MDATLIVLLIVFGLICTFIPFLSVAGREGRLRRGHGWYLDTSDQPLDREMRAQQSQAAMGPVQTGEASRRSILLWIAGGVGDLVIAALIWGVLGTKLFALIVALVGLSLFGMAFEARRANRYMATGPSHRAEDLLAGADQAEAEAQSLAATGESRKARELLLRTADDLRAFAPGSGHPDEILAKSRSLRDRAGSL
jgi:hypothetical protein